MYCSPIGHFVQIIHQLCVHRTTMRESYVAWMLRLPIGNNVKGIARKHRAQ